MCETGRDKRESRSGTEYLATQFYGELLIESILFGEFLLIKRSEGLGGGDDITKINTGEGDVY